MESCEWGGGGGGVRRGHVMPSGAAAAEPRRAARPSGCHSAPAPLRSSRLRSPPYPPWRPDHVPAEAPGRRLPRSPGRARWGPPAARAPTWGPAARRAPCCCCSGCCCSSGSRGPRGPRAPSSTSCAGGWPAGAQRGRWGAGALGEGRGPGSPPGCLSLGSGESCLRGGRGGETRVVRAGGDAGGARTWRRLVGLLPGVAESRRLFVRATGPSRRVRVTPCWRPQRPAPAARSGASAKVQDAGTIALLCPPPHVFLQVPRRGLGRPLAMEESTPPAGMAL